MSGGSVLWAEAPDEDAGEPAEPAADEGEVDDTFAARRLRRWLKGMFGGTAKRPVRDSGPVEGDPGEPGGSPD